MHRSVLRAVLFLGAVALWWVAYTLPFWEVTVRAPQYPMGLRVTVYLHRVEGDVWEINLLNHYIGMGRVDQAAEFERQYAWLGLLALSLLGLTALGPFRLVRWLALGGAWAFPVVFLGDLYYWLYQYGHRLDPHAPIRIRPFTPPLWGTGQIAQFQAVASLEVGFWVVLAAALSVTIGSFLRGQARSVRVPLTASVFIREGVR
ncbi:hypothetical protein HRbin11_01779 [bacterium HR11]|nr:hypothetical protein HRbin11_01779 [bacterium HR11]